MRMVVGLVFLLLLSVMPLSGAGGHNGIQMTTTSGRVGSPLPLIDTLSFPHVNGSRIEAVEHFMPFSPHTSAHKMNTSVNDPDFLNASTEHVTYGNGTIDIEDYAKVPGVGNNSLTVTSVVEWSGNMSFDRLTISCQAGSGCGVINVIDELTLRVNILEIQQGGRIYAADTIWNGTGRGIDGFSSDFPGEAGGSGAGHRWYGGMPGGGNGTGGLYRPGGMSYGWGDEKGSSGGNVTSPLINNQPNPGHGPSRPHNLSSMAGAGGGKVVILARSVIIDGGIDARGGRGENGPSHPSGNGNGLHGAGGGSGGSIHIVANTVGIGTFGYVKADGGSGGNGGRGSTISVPPGSFDGGNGGGGGSGGYVTIATKSGQYFANPLSVTATSGWGGVRGSPSNSGSYGINGTGGGWGHVSISTFQGWGPMPQVPNSGYGVIDIQDTMYLSGNLSLLLVRLSCSNVTCGKIVAIGPLNITAVKVILENGTSMESIWGATPAALGGDGFNNDTSMSDAGKAAGGGSSYLGDAGGGGQSNPKSNAGNGAQAHGNIFLDAGKGGDVYENGTIFSYGGYGGGQIRIWAGNIVINGTMTASGTDGEDPVRPSSGAYHAGRNGAGGGGGGLIALQANRIDVTGNILARGGDGGDGTLPYRSMTYVGCCVGGNGGGGGGGGSISLNTTTGNLYSTGLIDESSGVGGLAGSHAYSLIGAGEPGGTGVNGQYGTTTFSGYPVPPLYPWTGNITLGNITLAEGRVVDDLKLKIGSNTPQYTDIDVFVRSSLDNTTWQPWSEIDLNTGLMPRAAHLQIKFVLISHDGWTSPTLMGYQLDWDESDPIDRLLLESDWNDVILFTLDGADDGTGFKPVLTIQENASVSDAGSFSILFPSGAVPTGNGLVWSIDELREATWCDVTITGPNGTFGVSTASTDRGPHGTDLHISPTDLTSLMERNTSTPVHVDPEGIEWSTLWVNWSHGMQNTPAKVTHLRLTYSVVLDMGGLSDLASAVNTRIISQCGTLVSATTDCIPQHIAVVKGQRSRTTASTQTGYVNPIWIDDVAPEVTTSALSAERALFQPFEVNDDITLSVKVVRDEHDLTAEAWVFPNELDHFMEPPGTASDPLTWNAVDSAYVGLLTIPSEYALNESHSPRVALRLTDAQGNVFYDGDHINLALSPAKPNIATVSLSGQALEEGFAHDSPVEITVKDISGRDDFTFTLYLSRNSDIWTSGLVDIGGGLHHATFLPNRSSLGDWDVLITAKDTTSGGSHYPAVPPTVVRVRDGIEPTVISTKMDDRNVWEEELSVQVTWSAEQDEQVWVSIDLNDANDVSVSNTSINATGSGEGILDMILAQLPDGDYSLRVSVSDSAGNTGVKELGVVILNRTAVMMIDLTRSEADSLDDGTVQVILNVTCTPVCILTLMDQEGTSHLEPWTGDELNTKVEIIVPNTGLRLVATATYEDNAIQMYLDLPEWEEPLGGFETNLTTTDRGESGTGTGGTGNTTGTSNAAGAVTGGGFAIDGRLVMIIVAVAILAVLAILGLIASGLISRLPEKKVDVSDSSAETIDEFSREFDTAIETSVEGEAFSGPPVQSEAFSGPPVQSEAFSGPPVEVVVEEPVEPIEVSEALGIIGQSVDVATKLPVDWEKLPPGGGYDRDVDGVLWYCVPGQMEAWKQRSDGQFEHVPAGRPSS